MFEGRHWAGTPAHCGHEKPAEASRGALGKSPLQVLRGGRAFRSCGDCGGRASRGGHVVTATLAAGDVWEPFCRSVFPRTDPFSYSSCSPWRFTTCSGLFSPPAITLLTRLCQEPWRTARAPLPEPQLALCVVVSCLTCRPSLIGLATPYTYGGVLMVMVLVVCSRLGSSACLRSPRRTFCLGSRGRESWAGAARGGLGTAGGTDGRGGAVDNNAAGAGDDGAADARYTSAAAGLVEVPVDSSDEMLATRGRDVQGVACEGGRGREFRNAAHVYGVSGTQAGGADGARTSDVNGMEAGGIHGNVAEVVDDDGANYDRDSGVGAHRD